MKNYLQNIRTLSYNTVCSIINNIRHCLENYIKHLYCEKQIDRELDEDKKVAIDESLYIHNDLGGQIWMVGVVHTESKELRIDIMKNRNRDNLKPFVENHIIPGTHINHDGLIFYEFLDEDDSVYIHECHIHGGGDFCIGNHSTSKIEAIWSFIKNGIRFLYRIIPHTNYILYLWKIEFRYKISKLSKEDKEKKNYKCIKKCFELNEYDFYSIEELIDYKYIRLLN